MGNSSPCCLNNPRQSILCRLRKVSDIEVEIPNDFLSSHIPPKSKVNLKLPDNFNDQQSQHTVPNNSNTKPKRNRSSLIVKPFRYRLLTIDNSLLHRSNSEFFHLREYKKELENRLCNFSRKKQMLKFKYKLDDDSDLLSGNDTKNSIDDITTTQEQGNNNKQTQFQFQTNEDKLNTFIECCKSGKQTITESKLITLTKARVNDSPVSPVSRKRKRKIFEIINEPFSNKQLEYIKNILFEEEILIHEMDESTINTVINCLNYIRIKASHILYSLDKTNSNTKYNFEGVEQAQSQNKPSFSNFASNSDYNIPTNMNCNTSSNANNNNTTTTNEDYYYIIEHGKIEMNIDEKLFLLERDNTISTRALVKNSKKKCHLKTIKRVYLYRLPLTKYTSIFSDFVDKMQEEKVSFLKSTYLFSSFEKKTLQLLANGCIKQQYHQRTEIIKQESTPKAIYFVITGTVICLNKQQIVRKYRQGNVFGEVTFFTQMESFYGYQAEPDTVIYEIEYKTIEVVVGGPEGDNIIKILTQNVFNNAIKNSQVLSKYFTPSNNSIIFDIFQLKYYFNDTITSRKTKKVFLLLGGTLNENKTKHSHTIYPDSLLYEEELIHNEHSNPSHKAFLTTDECVIFEASWLELAKKIQCYSDRSVSMFDKMQYLRGIRFLKGINELKIFNLAEELRHINFKEGELIIKNGPISDKLYIIKSGKVSLVIRDVEVKVIEEKMSFGDISSQPGSYMHSASYYAKTHLECYYLTKDIFDDVIDCEILKPFNKMLLLKDITITLDQLFYLKDLGQGSYGKVYLVHDKKRLYAMKTAEMQAMIQNKERAQCYLNEKSIMSSIDHPFIVQLINTFKTREYIFFLIEYIKGSTLREYLNVYHSKLRNVEEITFLASILCHILAYLQKKRIIHRDLKPDNLMLDGSKGYIKAIDFGIAKDLSGKDSTHSLIGTMHYMSPEVVSGKNYSFSVDIWSVGVILYEVFYGKVPFGFGMKDPKDIYRDIRERKVILPCDPKIENVNVFIGSFLDKRPTERMNYFYKWKSENLFIGFDFDKLIKMEMESPLLPVIDKKGGSKKNSIIYNSISLKQDDMNNTLCPFHQFIKNNILCSSNELDEIQKRDVYDYFTDF